MQGRVVGTKLRQPRGIYLYSSFIRDGVGESERRGSDTQQGAAANRPAAEVQGSERQQKSYHHSWAASSGCRGAAKQTGRRRRFSKRLVKKSDKGESAFTRH